MRFIINQAKLIFRALLFITAVGMYLFQWEQLVYIMHLNVIGNITPLHIMWAFLMAEMLVVPVPVLNNYVSCGKQFKKHYIPNTQIYDKARFLRYIRNMNHRAIILMGLWATITAFIGILYFNDIIGRIEMYLIMLFFYIGDEVCINIWCPFQTFIAKSKCCNTCRFYNWGHFMMFSHFVFIKSFYTLSLFTVSVLILIQCEYLYFRYPERFSEITNLALRCSYCRDNICRIKTYFAARLQKAFPNIKWLKPLYKQNKRN